MKNRTPKRPEGHFILDFTPVPRKRNRHDGWTAERQRAFIEALARTGSVSHAANAVNMATEGAYQLRLHPKAESFRKAWAAALDFGIQWLEDAAIERALNGVIEPVFGRDGQIGERRRYNDRLLMFILRHRMAERYAPYKDDVLTPRREAELRAQWEEERRRPAAGTWVLEELKRRLGIRKDEEIEEQKAREGAGQDKGDAPHGEEGKDAQPAPEPDQSQQKDEPFRGPRIWTF